MDDYCIYIYIYIYVICYIILIIFVKFIIFCGKVHKKGKYLMDLAVPSML